MRVERVTDPADIRLADFLELRDVQLRARREPEQGLFLAEGESTILRALLAGYEPRAVLTSPRWLPALQAAMPEDTPAFLADDETLESTTGFHVHRGALASFERKPLPKAEALLAEARRVVVLEDLVDHTNLGAILRSARALGFEAALLTPRCADPLYRRAVRTSMGAVFSMPWTRIGLRDGPETLRAHGFALLALTPALDATSISHLDAIAFPRLALALGSEGKGLSDRWVETADVRVRIPMRPGIDSLNVSAAAAVAMWVLGRTEDT